MQSGPEQNAVPFYKELERLASQHRPVEIVFRSRSGARTVIRDRIAGLYGPGGGEWLRTAAGLEIGLDRLEQVDGKRPPGPC